MTHKFTSIERRVLSRIQWDFPLHEDPYGVLSCELEIPREKVIAAVRGLRQRGVIRRLGGSFVPRRLGYVSVLVAGCVDATRLEAAAELAASFPEVTHDYERQDRLNLWFTVIADSQARLEEILGTLRKCDGVNELHALPALKTFKIRVDFDLKGHDAGGRPRQVPSVKPVRAERQNAAPYAVDEVDKLIIPRCCGDLGDSERPFAALAHELGVSEAMLLARLHAYHKAGILRRFGAILRHQAAGFTANGMSVWNVPEAAVDEVGRRMAEFPEISHCYERPRFAGWPYNVFGMIHGSTADECLGAAKRVAEVTGIADYRLLYSLREFKKTSMVYALANASESAPTGAGGVERPY